jgi:pantoate--beta-alanine ligase
MGGLHEGHLRLINKAKECADVVVASIFVNPTQFASGEDFEQYPQSPEKDIENLEKRQVDALFIPEISDIYPQSQDSDYDFGELAQILCGISRPTHFKGVAQVVARFFDIVKPDVAVFGEKDYQQLAIIKELVKRKYGNIEIVSVPIIRESDGLAMSTRNNYLSVKERVRAPLFYQVLRAAREDLESGKDVVLTAKRAITELSESFVVDYVEILDANTLKEITPKSKEIIIISAVRLGATRLIDNIVFRSANV